MFELPIVRYFDVNRSAGDIGLEIEVEGQKLPYVESMVWTSHKDGSLRGENYEYVFAFPQKYDDLEAALKELRTRFEEAKSVLDFNYRTSVHVHLNVQQWTMQELFTFASIWLIFDELMVAYAGKERGGNLFCLRAADAEKLPMMLASAAKDIGNGKHGWRGVGDAIRYASLNFAALTKFGSIEFRALRGTADPDIIRQWVSLIKALDDAMRRYNSPRDVVADFMAMGSEGFLHSIMPEWFCDFAKGVDFHQMMKEGLIYSFELAHATSRWITAEKHKEYRHPQGYVDKDTLRHHEANVAFRKKSLAQILANAPQPEPARPRARAQQVRLNQGAVGNVIIDDVADANAMVANRWRDIAAAEIRAAQAQPAVRNGWAQVQAAPLFNAFDEPIPDQEF